MMITPGATLRQTPVVSGDQKGEKLALPVFLTHKPPWRSLSCDPRKHLDRPQAMAFCVSNVDRHRLFAIHHGARPR